ncbi:hypothetical protein U0070_012145 [Myodes glareolus]|uniref:NADH dehydrogenase [ubiquinone] 1 beta subcomplex subunit 5, mitochondrial n=1 Tax=Myodes glareolus TaxID=447135 RepID=A0AAW0K2A4_MYOGA
MAAMSLLQWALVTALTALSVRLASSRLGVGSFLTPSFQKTVAPVQHSGDHGKRLFVIKPTSYYDSSFLSRTRRNPRRLQHWEYYKHPISRWIARTFYDCPEKNYEQTLAILQIESEKVDLGLKEHEVRRLMRSWADGPWFQYPTPEKEFIDHSPKVTPDN